MAQPSHDVSPPLAAIATWVVPGAGYWLLGQRARAMTVGVTVVVLFVLGLLIGGVRALEVPGWDDDGSKIRLNAKGEKVLTEYGPSYSRGTWVMASRPLTELRAKPWYIAQVLAGPVALASSAWSIWASTAPDSPEGDAQPPGATSHARVNEIGVLYMAVAGMLNLLAMIDASHRASQGQPEANR